MTDRPRFEMPDTTAQEVRTAQLGSLREMLARVYRQVPHYQRAFDDAGLVPDDLRTLEDLARFPFTTKDDLLIWEDHFLPEVVDPVTLEVLPDGEEGELVLTTLTRKAMPVVRYRTRDLTRLLPGTAYPAFRRMQRVTGRTDDMMIVRGVNVFPTQVEELLLTVEGLTPHYLCVLTRPGNLDELTVRVEARGSVRESDRPGLGARLERLVKDHVGVTVAVEVVPPHALERSLGKAKRISDQR
jgi:phenylacetate-CoA ligase